MSLNNTYNTHKPVLAPVNGTAEEKFDSHWLYRGADKSLSHHEGNKLMFLSERREFPSAPCLAGKET